LGFEEINDKEAISRFSDVQAVGVGFSTEGKMSVGEVSLVFVPAWRRYEIGAFKHLKFVHLVATFRVEAYLIEVDSSMLESVFRISGSVSNHDDIVDDLQIVSLRCTGLIWSPRKCFKAGERGDVDVDASSPLLAGSNSKDLVFGCCDFPAVFQSLLIG
jgi:hypothetical protein